MTENEVDILRDNGYMAESVRVNDTDHVCLKAAQHDWYYRDGYTSGAAYFADNRTMMRDPTVCVAVLEFVIDGPSPLSDKFAVELVKALAPADKLLKKYNRPLVRVTAESVHAIYQSALAPFLYDEQCRRLFEHGFRFPDAVQYSGATLRATCGTVPLDGAWLDERSPLTVKRDTLPLWDADDTAKKLRTLIDRTVAAGGIIERGPYTPPTPVYERVERDPNRIDYGDPAIQRALGLRD